MSDVETQFEPDDYEGLEEKTATLPRREVRRFERDRKALQSAQAEMEEMRRQLAFARAGIDVDDPAAKYFVRGYDGELDRDSIIAAAIEVRLIGQPPAGSDVVAGHEMLSRAAAGATEPSQEDEITRQLAEAGKRHWRDADQAIPEIMKIIDANDIKLHVTG
jgi:ribosomal protein L12E/L44/L45/RPP1/RPP2